MQDVERRMIGGNVFVQQSEKFHSGSYSCRSPDKKLAASFDLVILAGIYFLIILFSSILIEICFKAVRSKISARENACWL